MGHCQPSGTRVCLQSAYSMRRVCAKCNTAVGRYKNMTKMYHPAPWIETPGGRLGVLDSDLGSLAHTKTMKEPSKNLEWNNQKISKTQQESLIYIRRLIRSNIIQ